MFFDPAKVAMALTVLTLKLCVWLVKACFQLCLFVFSLFIELVVSRLPAEDTALDNGQAHLIEYSGSIRQFYQELIAVLEQRQLPDVEMEFLELNEGGWGSHRRQYLKIRWHEFYYVVGAAGFGPSLVVSVRLLSTESGWGLSPDAPVLHQLLRQLFKPPTPYHQDMQRAFQHHVGSALREVLNELGQGTIRSLPAAERAGILRDLERSLDP